MLYIQRTGHSFQRAPKKWKMKSPKRLNWLRMQLHWHQERQIRKPTLTSLLMWSTVTWPVFFWHPTSSSFLLVKAGRDASNHWNNQLKDSRQPCCAHHEKHFRYLPGGDDKYEAYIPYVSQADELCNYLRLTDHMVRSENPLSWVVGKRTWY